MKLLIPEYVSSAITLLQQAGFEAFVVGGAVRDALLGKNPTDWDITTNALVEQMQNTFPKHFNTGLKHGTVTVLSKGEPIEITTYRIDGEYSDNRHPKSVTFTQNLADDLNRRDFTINALAYNEQAGIVDIFGGLSDIDKKIIRCVGNADTRFNEDALRILRALRFSAVLNFNIEEQTFDSIKRNKNLLKNISSERINSELTKLILSNNKLEDFISSGVCSVILPELEQCFKIQQNNPHHIYNVGNHSIKTVLNIPSDVALRYAALFHDLGKAQTRTTDNNGTDHFHGHAKISKDIASDILNRLKFDNKSKSEILTLIELHDAQIDLTQKSVRRLLSKIGEDMLRKLISLKRADALAQNPIYLDEKLKYLVDLEKILDEILQQKQLLSIKDLAIDGHDLIDIGIKGKKIGDTLCMLFDRVLENPKLNNREALINMAKDNIR